MSSLTRIVPWSQQLICEVLCPGDLAVDLTAGKGRDTCALAAAVGNEGQVVSFDLQEEAIELTADLLQKHDCTVQFWPAAQVVPKRPGVFLLKSCHSAIDNILPAPVKAVIANLGYLPGGDRSLVTRPDSTLTALQKAVEWLLPGGRIAVTVYPSHPGGRQEYEAVNSFFCQLPGDLWQVLSLSVPNQEDAPCLMVAERRA